MKQQGEIRKDIEKPFKELKYPRFKWKLGTWLTVVSALVTFIFFVFPKINEGTIDARRIYLFAAIAVGPFIIFSCLPWLFRMSQISYKRVNSYSLLWEVWKGQIQNIADMRTMVANLIKSGISVQSFEIEKASFEKGRLYILLLKKSKHDLNIDDLVEVLDQADNKWMGQFKITEVREQVYFACGINGVDPVWFGYVRENHEIGVVPDMIAVRFVGGQHGR